MTRIILMSLILQMKQSLARPTYRFTLIIQPILYTILMVALFSVSNSLNFMTFVVLGTGILTLWSSIAFSSAGDLDRERYMGTLKHIFCAPVNFRFVIYSKVLGNTILGLFPFVIMFLGVAIFKSEYFYIAHPIWFLVGFALSVASFMAISLVFSALFALSRSARILMNCLEYPVFILCGIAFPITVLPEPLRLISFCLSPTWAVSILRSSIEGIDNKNIFLYEVLILSALILIYFVIAHILFHIFDRLVRKNATLEVC